VVEDQTTHDVLYAWTGPWWEIQYGETGRPREDVARKIFSAMRLRDTPEGMVVQAWGGSVRASYCSVVKEFGSLGDLFIDRPGAFSPLPAWRGHVVAGGEIWTEPLGESAIGRGRAEALILGTASAVGRLVPLNDSDRSSSRALEALSGVDIEWTS
jgi:hypothetical protein